MNNRREPPKLVDKSIVIIIDPDVSYEEHLKQFEQKTEEINNALLYG